MKVKPNLNKLLKDRNMTQMKLSSLSGVPQGTISRFDQKKRHEASHLFSIANALEVKIEDLFTVVSS